MRVTCSDCLTNVLLGKVNVKIVELNLTLKSGKRSIAVSHLDLPGGNYTVTLYGEWSCCFYEGECGCV